MARPSLWSRLRGKRTRETAVNDIHAELRFHEDRLAERLEAEGLAPDRARAEARRRVGNQPLLQDRALDAHGGRWFDALVQDLRYGARRLRRQPGFAAIAILTVALGIGANAAIFSVASGVLLRPLPYPNADRLVMVWMDNARLKLREDWHSWPEIDDYRKMSTSFEDIAVFNAMARTITGSGEPERVIGAHSSPNLFTVLGVQAAKGRTYTEAENTPASNGVIVLSHGFWQRQFGGRADALESTMQINGRAVRVIGVMPEGFAFPNADTAFWMPTGPAEAQRTNRNSLWLQSIGRLKPGVSVATAQADLARINAGNAERFPDQRGYGVFVIDYLTQLVGSVRTAILILLGAVACVLLIACTNVANLLLARATVRDREMALRAAIGAGRSRLVRQMLTESVLLAGLGGLAGIGLAWLGLQALVAAAPADLPRLADIRLDRTVLAFTAGLSLVTGLIFGLVPAIQVAIGDPNRALREGGRSATGLGHAIRRGLVVVEIGAAVVLLVGAGLMIRSFDAIQHVNLGFEPEDLVTGRVTTYGERYAQGPARALFLSQVLERAGTAPGVTGAAAIGSLFLGATPNSTIFCIEGRPDFAPEDRVEVPVDAVSPNYFSVMRIPLAKGRFFDTRDSAEAPPAVMINTTMANMFWPDADPIGRRIKYGTLSSTGPWMTIVGVVGDTRRTGFEAAVRPETYLPHAQSPAGSMLLVARASGDTGRAIGALREAARATDTAVPLQAPRTVDELVGGLTAQRRLNTLLLAIFGVVAAALAVIGVYGVLGYSVAERTREIGVRIALGASRGGILRLFLAEGMMLAGIGIAVGLGTALALSRAITSLLYQISAADPVTLAAIAALAAAAALAACVIPAVRAARLPPTHALRSE
jgi:putative ABC transport system permease protein